jgi:WD40 repeat protein/serine/threonine protein kinase
LGRHVALKVLPFAAAFDPKQLRRFQLEAQAAACLHHTHIVPIHAVGCERGVPYYAMQLIDGYSLARVIADLRQLEGLDSRGGPGQALTASMSETPAASSTARQLSRRGDGSALEFALTTGPRCTDPGTALPSPPLIAISEEPTGRSGVATNRYSSTSDPAYIRGVARLGAQAAEALEHAHVRGILHRDIKPGNLLLDAEGNLWVTDFGLAQIEGNSRLTLTGDVLGTLRYMSPEQALGRRVVIDGRTDVYSLGVTLYELLTLRPAVDGRDRAEILRRIAEKEPVPLRVFNPTVPRDLETILIKAVQKEPLARYAGAGELAADLRRFLEGRVILGRRPTLWDRALKWARLHPAIVVLGTAILLVAVLGLSISNILIDHQKRRAESAYQIAAVLSQEAKEKAASLERQLYINRVNLAQRDLSANITAAAGLLDRCPEPLRGWEWNYLKRLTHVDLRTIRLHTQPVFALAFAPGGDRLVSGGGASHSFAQEGDSAELILSDRATGSEVRRFTGLRGGVWSVAFAPGGHRLVSGSGFYRPRRAGQVTCWDTTTGKVRWQRVEDNVNVLGLAYSPDGRHVAAALGDRGTNLKGFVEVFDADDGEVLNRFFGEGGGFDGVAYSPDGRVLALAAPKAVVLASADATGGPGGPHSRELRRFSVLCDWVTALAFSPDGTRLAAVGNDGMLRLWDPVNGAPVLAVRAHGDYIYGVRFNTDGTRIATAGLDQSIKIWDSADGVEMAAVFGHTGPVTGVDFSPDGRQLVSASADRTLKLWDSSPTGQINVQGRTGWVHGLAFSPDGSRLASASADHTVRLFDSQTRALIATFSVPWGWMFDVAVSPDGKLLASAGEDGTIRLWDISTRQAIQTLVGHSDYVKSVAFSPDGRLVASASEDHTIRLWEVATGHALHTLNGHEGRVYKVAFSPDGQVLASASEDQTVRVWDSLSGQERLTFKAHTGRVMCLAFGPGGHSIASAGTDRTVRLWDTSTGRVHHTLRGHSEEIAGLAFGPDGSRIVSVSYDGSVKLWDAATGEEVLTLRGHGAGVASVAQSPDGYRLATGSTNGKIRIWDATPLGGSAGEGR